MAVQTVTTRLVFDTQQQEEAIRQARELEKELGLAEGQAEELTKQFQLQSKSLDELVKQEKELTKQRNKSQDPKEIIRLNKEITKTQKSIRTIKGEFRQASKEVKNVGRQGKASFGVLQKAAQTLGPAIAAAFSFQLIKDFIASTIDAAARFEQTQVAFTTLLGGSGEAANKLIADLERLSLATPLTPESLNQATQTLLSFGIAQENILPTLQRLGDVAQGDSEKLQQLSLVFGQISSAGKLTGQDLLQLINVGFNPLQVISEQTGKSVADLKKDMENGLITFDKVEEAFKTATEEGGLFFNAMVNQSETFSGRVSTLEGNVNALQRQIGDQLLPVAGQVVELLLAMSENADKVGEEFKFLSSIMEGLLFLLKAVTEEEKESAAATTALGRVIQNIISPIDGAISAFNDLERDLSAVIAAIEGVITEIAELFGLDIATPFKDAADAARELEMRQAANQRQVEFLTSAMEKFKETTGATDDEVAAFRAQFRGFETDGLSVGDAVNKLGVEFGKFLEQSRASEQEVKNYSNTIKGLKDRLSDLRKEQEGVDLGTEAGRKRFSQLGIEITALEKRITKLTKKNKDDFELWGETAKGQAEQIEKNIREGISLIEADINAFRAKSADGLFPVNINTDAIQDIYKNTEENLTEITKENEAQRNELRQKSAELEFQRQKQRLDIATQFSTSFFNLLNQQRETELQNNLIRLNTRREQELANENLTNEERLAINEKFDSQQAVIEKAANERQQKAAVTQAIIENSLLVLRALATPPAPNFAAAGIAAGLGLFQIATIKAQQFAKGGIDIAGPGTGTSDSIPAYISRGESVITAARTREYKPALQGIADGSLDPNILNHMALNGLTNVAAEKIGRNQVIMMGQNNTELKRELSQVKEILREIKNKPTWILKGREFGGAVNKRIGKNTYIKAGL